MILIFTHLTRPTIAMLRSLSSSTNLLRTSRRFSSSISFLPSSEVVDRVIAVARSIPVTPLDISQNSHLVADLKYDSLLRREFAAKLEDEFAVTIPQNFSSTYLSIQQVVNYFATHPKAR